MGHFLIGAGSGFVVGFLAAAYLLYRRELQIVEKVTERLDAQQNRALVSEMGQHGFSEQEVRASVGFMRMRYHGERFPSA